MKSERDKQIQSLTESHHDVNTQADSTFTTASKFYSLELYYHIKLQYKQLHPYSCSCGPESLYKKVQIGPNFALWNDTLMFTFQNFV